MEMLALCIGEELRLSSSYHFPPITSAYIYVQPYDRSAEGYSFPVERLH